MFWLKIIQDRLAGICQFHLNITNIKNDIKKAFIKTNDQWSQC